MITFVNALLICVLCGVGWYSFAKPRKTAKKQWFTKSDTPAPNVRVPFFTRVYVVRCWREQTTPHHETVTRCTLDIPATGQRRGFTNPEALLDTLSAELTQMQEAQPSAK